METISLNINGVCRELAVGKNWTLLKMLRDGLRTHRDKNAAVRQGTAEPAWSS